MEWHDKHTSRLHHVLAQRAKSRSKKKRKNEKKKKKEGQSNNGKQHKDEGATDGDQLSITRPSLSSMTWPRPKKTIQEWEYAWTMPIRV